MCAIFGFISRRHESPDLKTLGRIVRGNIARGPHAFGFAWINVDGRLRAYRQCGRLTDCMGALAMARDARLLIGHLRWATHGQPGDNINNHPHPADGGWIVHNGIVRNAEELVAEHRLWPSSECDSEIIGLMMEEGCGSLLSRCADAVESTTGPLAMLGLWSRPDAMVAVRRGNPLHCGLADEGLYLATMAQGLPGPVKALADNTARIFSLDRKGTRHVHVQKIAQDPDAYVSDDRGGAGLFGGRGRAKAYRGG